MTTCTKYHWKQCIMGSDLYILLADPIHVSTVCNAPKDEMFIVQRVFKNVPIFIFQNKMNYFFQFFIVVVEIVQIKITPCNCAIYLQGKNIFRIYTNLESAHNMHQNECQVYVWPSSSCDIKELDLSIIKQCCKYEAN